MMEWRMPQNVWQWLLLIAPAIVAMIACRSTELWILPVPYLHIENGIDIVDSAAIVVRETKLALAIITTFSLVISLFVVRELSLLRRFGAVIVMMLFLIFVNSFAALGGCAVSCYFEARR